ncbi:hypothetical protein [Marinisporobacter balticus]|uniref:Uncharacterized protein n=1 Tax=Marinisporobacter balticus TaxID=2018667 RepID=A0A4R2KQ72_9FIRM|nr:hypothetical protein [Marinisporobacter balticus]TCO74827.1 hypothetical protein EV214_11190 [Marinisporobacter balticus]
MKNKNGTNFSANDAENMIDATYNKDDYPIIEKTQNAYVMPLDMQRDVDEIDPSKFYEDTAATNHSLVKDFSTSHQNKKKNKK